MEFTSTHLSGADFLEGVQGECTPLKFSSTPQEKFKNRVRTVRLYYYLLSS